MSRSLFVKAILLYFSGLLLFALLLFLPAGTLRYPQGMILTAVLSVPMFAAGLIMMKKSPELLKKRLNLNERESEQKKVIGFSGIMFIAAFAAAGLSFRFNFMMLPFALSCASVVLFLAAYAVYAEVLRENAENTDIILFSSLL